jgi:hypothetical protein
MAESTARLLDTQAMNLEVEDVRCINTFTFDYLRLMVSS